MNTMTSGSLTGHAGIEADVKKHNDGNKYKTDVWIDNRELEDVMANRASEGYELFDSHVGENVSTLLWRKA